MLSDATRSDRDAAGASAPTSPTALSVRGVDIDFGGVHALSDVTFDVARGQTCGLIGPNGAGKTSLFNVISRIYKPTRGSVFFEGSEITDIPRPRVMRLGIARTFQHTVLMPGLTVLENVMLGSQEHRRVGVVAAALRLPSHTRTEATLRAHALECLDYVGLAEFAHLPPDSLAYGFQKRVELARALCSESRLLLLDEPAAGLNHTEVDELATVLQRLREDFSLTVLLVEHHMALVMRIADQIVVLNSGRVIAQGAPADVQQDPAVVEAYLGSSGD